MSNSKEYVSSVLATVKRRNGSQPEFLEAVSEVLNSLVPALEANPQFERNAILERLTEPERGIIFRVAWEDDQENAVPLSDEGPGEASVLFINCVGSAPPG